MYKLWVWWCSAPFGLRSSFSNTSFAVEVLLAASTRACYRQFNWCCRCVCMHVSLAYAAQLQSAVSVRASWAWLIGLRSEEGWRVAFNTQDALYVPLGITTTIVPVVSNRTRQVTAIQLLERQCHPSSRCLNRSSREVDLRAATSAVGLEELRWSSRSHLPRRAHCLAKTL